MSESTWFIDPEAGPVSVEDDAEYDQQIYHDDPNVDDDYYDEDRIIGNHHGQPHSPDKPFYPDGYGSSESPGGGTEFSIPTVSQSGMISRGQFTSASNYTLGSLEMSPDNSARDMDSPADRGTRSDWHLPPQSPPSVNSSNEHQHSPSSVTRGAQEILRQRNQQRRARQTRPPPSPRSGSALSPGETSVSSAETPIHHGPQRTAAVVESALSNGGNWESGSARSEFSGGGSSVWTTEEDGVPYDARSSRRALILQMAKARMKSNTSGSNISAKTPALRLDDEKKDSLDVLSSDGIDFASDLD